MSDFRRPPTAQEAVLVELRRALVAGEMPPGTKIAQEAVAQSLGVSRHPIREALKVLEGEGQIRYEPQRGYFVADLDPAELVEIYRLRELLENEATRVGTAALTEADIAQLETIYVEIDQAMANDDVAALTEANRRFHFVLLTPCAMPRLLRMVGQLWDSSNPYRARHFGEQENRLTSQREHALMLDAARARDTDLLVQLSDQHRAHAVPTLRRTLGQA
jgi:DNA-binding GntR family transcriptional regulator